MAQFHQFHLKAIDVDHGEQDAAGAGRPQAHEDGDGDDATAIQIPMTSPRRGLMLLGFFFDMERCNIDIYLQNVKYTYN